MSKLIPKECKRLAEVDFPIAVVSKHSAREKSIRHGHPSTLHLWWARRPLAACRAMLLALLLPDPCDPFCPEDFKSKARDILPQVTGAIRPNDLDLRKALLKFIGDFSNWGLSSNQTYLEVGRGLVRAAHPEETPLVVDPFAGGGSIPLEALRLGCEAFASDLNPVACLILKVVLDDIPRHGPKLAEEVRRVGGEIKKQAVKELGELYPKDPDGATPIGYLWARTVKCESPNCGAEIPLMRSSWLCTKASRRRALKHKVVRPKGEPPHVEFEVFVPKSEKEVTGGTVTLAKATCLACGSVLPPVRVRVQLAEQRGGADVVFDMKGQRIGGARMLAVVTLQAGIQGRNYRLPSESDYEVVRTAQAHIATILDEWERGGKQGLCPVPDESTPQDGTGSVGGGFRTRKYGVATFGDLFTARQKLVLVELARLVSQIQDAGLKTLLAFAVSKQSDFNSSLSRWANHMEKSVATFGRQALPMLWDWGEVVPLGSSSGAFSVAAEWIASASESLVAMHYRSGQVQQADATEHPLPNEAAGVWFTDPPYYDSVPYADLADFFLVWLKRTLSKHPLLRDAFDPIIAMSSKVREVVRDEQEHLDGRPKKSTEWYEERMHRAFAEARRVLRMDGVGSVVFAHKTTEGWEALLSGLTRAGWTITGSWPIATEKPDRMRAMESAALATSVHLVCRPRPEDAPIGDWGDVLQELPKRVGNWMERLQSEGIRGADLVFACIGPALEIYSRYSRVVDAEEREIPLGGDPEDSEPHKRGFLSYVWEVVGRTALEQVLGTTEAKARNSTAGALEEDARLTALFLWTLQSTNGESPSPQPSPTKGRGDNREDSPTKGRGSEEEEEEEGDEEEEIPKKKKQGYSLIFDVVRRFAQPLGIHLPEWEGRVIETEKGVVRLLSVKERGKQLFGEESISVAGFRIEEQARRDPQMKFDFAFGADRAIAPDLPAGALAQAGIKSRRPRKKKEIAAESRPKAGVITTLDRVHAAMLLQASGQTNALRALLKAEQERGPDFIRLANALSALYPKQSEEKRLLDAMLLIVPR